MNKRRENSKGQALVLVTLALVAMAGMMGLAVDLGWSFFVQKQAQAAADGAALAAVQEAMAQLSAGTDVTSLCSTVSPTGVSCSAAATKCPSTKNLQNGCEYAIANGFDYTNDTRQSVWIQSGTGTAPTVPKVNGVIYWVTVRTVETIPQLFSAVFSHTQGTVSAIATAAIAPSVGPGSFYGMNRKGDCITDPSSQGYPGCGLDVVTGTGSGGTSCGSTNANLCAPAGIILASSCSAAGAGCSQAYAGVASGPGAWGSSLTVMGNGAGGGGAVSGNWTPPTPVWTTSPGTFQDPTYHNSQPPLQVPTPSSAATAITSCGYLAGSPTGSGTIPSAGGSLGPYQYYSYYKTGSGIIQPTGAPVTMPANAVFTTGNPGCPGASIPASNVLVQPGALSGSGTGQSSSFPTYIFWGGASFNNATFTAGQYVMAGTCATCSGSVFDVTGTVTGNTSTGTMFIFTDGMYPSLWNAPGAAAGTGEIANIPNGPTYLAGLSQGTIGPFKNSNITLSGLVSSNNSSSALPSGMNTYSGIVWWQDRRNSAVGYNEASGSTGCPDCTGDDGSVLYCTTNGDCTIPSTAKLNTLLAANHVTSTSPGVTMNPGNANIALNGVYYQPRGAWLELVHGTTGFSCSGSSAPQCPLQVVTGALIEDTGDVAVLLAGPTNPLLSYKARLIQ